VKWSTAKSVELWLGMHAMETTDHMEGTGRITVMESEDGAIIRLFAA
jgi:hypothetical protein